MKLTSTKHYNYLQDSLQGLFLINIPIKGICTTIMGVLCYITGAGYRVRAYAVNSAGTSYGSTVDVKTLSAFIPRTM